MALLLHPPDPLPILAQLQLLFPPQLRIPIPVLHLGLVLSHDPVLPPVVAAMVVMAAVVAAAVAAPTLDTALPASPPSPPAPCHPFTAGPLGPGAAVPAHGGHLLAILASHPKPLGLPPAALGPMVAVVLTLVTVAVLVVEEMGVVAVVELVVTLIPVPVLAAPPTIIALPLPPVVMPPLRPSHSSPRLFLRTNA